MNLRPLYLSICEHGQRDIALLVYVVMIFLYISLNLIAQGSKMAFHSVIDFGTSPD